MEPGSNSRKALAYGKNFSACTKCTNFCFANHQSSNDPPLLHHRHAPSAGGVGGGGGGGNDQMQLPAPSFIKLILDSNEDHRTRFLVSKKKKK